MGDVFVFKVLLVGDAGVGKSSILRCCIDAKFDPNYSPTIGVEFGIRNLQFGCATAKLQIWDMAGQERFRSITPAYYRGAMGVMLVYDVTSRMSFRHLDDWIKEIKKYEGSPLLMILGSKCDVDAAQIEVPTKEGAEYAQRVGATFMEVSARLGNGVEEAFALKAENLLRVKANADVCRPGGVRLPQPGDAIPCTTARSSSPRCCK